MRRTIATGAMLVLGGALALTGCTNQKNSNNVTSGSKGPASPATSGNYGNKTDLAPPYGAPKTAQPNAQSTGGKTRYPQSARDKEQRKGSPTSAASNQQP